MRSLGLIRSCALLGRTVALACACVGALAVSARAQTTQPFSTANIYGFGDPLEGIKLEAMFGLTNDLADFGAGQTNFIEVETLPGARSAVQQPLVRRVSLSARPRRLGRLHQ